MKDVQVVDTKDDDTIIKALDRELARVDKDLQAFVGANHAELAALLNGVKGVGKATISTLLAEVPELSKRVKRFYATFPVFEEDPETVASIVNTLGYELTPAMHGLFDEVFSFAKTFLVEDEGERCPATGPVGHRSDRAP